MGAAVGVWAGVSCALGVSARGTAAGLCAAAFPAQLASQPCKPAARPDAQSPPLLLACSAAARLLGPTLSAVDAFLLRNGRDVAAALPALHDALHGGLLRGGGRDPRLRDAVLAYLRTQLALGTLRGSWRQLDDVREWVERELSQPGFKW